MSAAGRRWVELRVRCPSGGGREALVPGGLVSLGARAVQEEEGWFVSHLEDSGDLEALRGRVRDFLTAACGLDHLEVTLRRCEHEDWAEAWKRGLEPRRIGRRLVVTPSWFPVEAGPGDVVVVLDPGMAFGTAEHGTTRGCLRLLEEAVAPGDRVLDLGAGSGILAIAAAGLGAGDVLAVEGDPVAVDALAENVARNGAESRVRWSTEWVDADRLATFGPRDGVVANIETGVLEALLPGFESALAGRGWLILSGVTCDEWPSMRSAVEGAGFRLDSMDRDGEWCSALFGLARGTEEAPPVE